MDFDRAPGKPEICDGEDNDCLGGVDTTSSGYNVCHVQARIDQKMETDVLVVLDNSVSMQALYWSLAAKAPTRWRAT